MSGSVECYWGETKSEIDVFVKEVIEEIGTIRKCLSGEETEEKKATTRTVSQQHQHSLALDGASSNNNKVDMDSGRPADAAALNRHDRAGIADSIVDGRPSEAEVKDKLQKLRLETQQATSSDDTFTSFSALSNSVVAEETIDAWQDDDDDADDELSWRMSPLKSMSDWVIKVVTPRENNKADVYHVHKSILAVGPRRSSFFANLFREHNQQQALLQQCNNTNNGKNTIAGEAMSYSHARSTSWQLPEIPSATNILAGVGGGLTNHHPISTNETATSKTTMTTTTLLELEGLAAAAFPCLLDFLYDPQARINLTTQNATALHVLAQRLEIKSLRARARDFWMQDMGMDNLAVYYEHSSTRVLDDPLILRAVEMYCAQHLFDVRGNCTIADILDQIDPQFLLNVITLASNDAVDREAFSLRLSLIIAVYCNMHQRELDDLMFHRLTDARHLPAIEAQAARAFLELQEVLSGGPNDRITSLTERCIAVLAENWDDACVVVPSHVKSGGGGGHGMTSNVTVSLPRLVGKALEGFVSDSFVNAKQRIVRLEAEKEDSQRQNDDIKRHNDDLQQHNECLQRQLLEMQQKCDELAARHRASSNGSPVPTENIKNGVVVYNGSQQTAAARTEGYPRTDEAAVAESEGRFLQRIEPSRVADRPKLPRAR